MHTNSVYVQLLHPSLPPPGSSWRRVVGSSHYELRVTALGARVEWARVGGASAAGGRAGAGAGAGVCTANLSLSQLRAGELRVGAPAPAPLQAGALDRQ